MLGLMVHWLLDICILSAVRIEHANCFTVLYVRFLSLLTVCSFTPFH